MKHISESIIGRKGLERFYIVWPNWSTGVTCLRKEEKFEELETQHHNTVFIISESDLINNRHLFDNTDAMDAVFYRSEKPDTISNVINKLKEFIKTGDVDDILDIGFKQCEIDEIWKKLKIKI